LSFEVLDCLDSLVCLTKRTPSLDGAVPVRVARGCSPLLEGNAYGFQLSLSRPLELRRRLGRWQAQFDGEPGRALKHFHQAVLARLAFEGLLPSPLWRRSLGRGLVVGSRDGVRLFTGLLVKPEPGTWLRLTAAANRRNTQFEVPEQLVPDDGAWVPLVVELRPRRGSPKRLRVEGEIASLAPLRPGLRIETRPIAEAPELAEAHAAFYDREYFEAKKQGVTGKYREQIASQKMRGVPAEVTARLIVVGHSRVAVEALDRFTTARGPTPEARPHEPRRLETVVVRNELSFTACFDGHSLELRYDRHELRRLSAAVERAYTLAVGEPAREHPGSSLYLTKYFTPHPPGEPHFFVKPWAFTETPPGWSSLLDGFHGDGWDVLRGVVSTDAFFATPAVFRVIREGVAVRVAAGQPLLRVIPLPRELLAAGYRLERLAT
jgi:hypothetical protein